MAGDLMEERQTRGAGWFWLHVLRVALTLWRNAAMDAPLRLLALTTAGCLLFIAPAFGGVAAVRLVPHMGPINLLALLLFWWGGAFWIGISLVSLAPRRGMAACATLAMAGVALLSAIAEFDLFSAAGLAAAAPLLLGGARARRRIIA
jgi:hypothetical protein